MGIAVYPGTFDPITLGHLDIIRRAASLFDELIVCVMANSAKKPLFTGAERAGLIKKATAAFPNVTVESSEDLLVRYMKGRGAKVIVKGLRAASDFDWELQIALVNRKLDPGIETLFMPSDGKYAYLTSSAAKEMARYGAGLEAFVPREIIEDLQEKIKIEMRGGVQ